MDDGIKTLNQTLENLVAGCLAQEASSSVLFNVTSGGASERPTQNSRSTNPGLEVSSGMTLMVEEEM